MLLALRVSFRLGSTHGLPPNPPRPLQLPSVLGDPFRPDAEDVPTSPHFILQSYSHTRTQPQEVRVQSTPFHQGKVRLREAEGLAPYW